MSEQLTSARVTVDDDPRTFTKWALEQGWGDGLPLIPPTPELVELFIAAAGLPADHVVAYLPPLRDICTVEKVAINAAMAGADPEAMPLMIAAIDAMAEPGFNLSALNATTGSVVPALIVNGDIRDRLGIPYQAGCFGGQAGSAPAVGRALRLVMRNVAGQLIGVTSQSVFGQPGRVCGIVVGEWEERSPWAPFAERRAAIKGDAVSVYGAMGTTNICDLVADTGELLLEMIGKSLAYPGANGFLTSSAFSETLVAINPVWAEIIARDVPSILDVQQLIWEHAANPIDHWAPQYKASIEAAGRIRSDGRVHLVQSPEDVFVVVCGGLGNLHSMAVHSWGDTVTQTKAVGP
jgi:hypothetical protein